MRNILKFVILAAFAVSSLLSCSDDENTVMVSSNPFALNRDSAITFMLTNIQLNADCFTIDYPITLATYTDRYVIDQTHEITDDAALAAFLQGLGESYYAIQYPFNLVNRGGVETEITDNQSFLDIFMVQVNACNACDATNTLFRQAYDSQAGTEETAMATRTHEYTFSTEADGTICSIGYKGETEELEYFIEILAPDGTALYTGTHSFSAENEEYIAIQDIDITAGEQYTVRRTVPTDAGQGTGMLKFTQLPFTHEGLTIHQARFYGGGGDLEPVLDKLPFIDFVFKPLQ